MLSPSRGAVQLLDHGVDAADGSGGLGQVVADGHQGGLIGDGYVEALEIPHPQEVAQLVRGTSKSS